MARIWAVAGYRYVLVTGLKTRGGSTISPQTVKNIFLNASKNRYFEYLIRACADFNLLPAKVD